MRAGREGEKMRREAGVRDAAGLYCTSAHMGLPAAAVNVMITLTTAANHICSWEYGMLFLKGFFSLFRLRNHPQMIQHTMCTCSVKYSPYRPFWDKL